MKKRAKEKKVSTKKSRFLNSKAWVFVGIAAFIIALIALSFTNVPSSVSTTGNVISGEAVDKNLITNMFNGWANGQIDTTLAKWIIFVMVTLLIISILNLTGLFANTIGYLIGIIVGFLATWYLTPADVYVILASYTALGMTLSTIIPFVILFLFSVAMFNPFKRGSQGEELYDHRKINIYSAIIVSFMWLLFTGFLIYKDIQYLGMGQDWTTGLGIMMIVITACSLFMFLFSSRFQRFIINLAIRMRRLRRETGRRLDEI